MHRARGFSQIMRQEPQCILSFDNNSLHFFGLTVYLCLQIASKIGISPFNGNELRDDLISYVKHQRTAEPEDGGEKGGVCRKINKAISNNKDRKGGGKHISEGVTLVNRVENAYGKEYDRRDKVYIQNRFGNAIKCAVHEGTREKERGDREERYAKRRTQMNPSQPLAEAEGCTDQNCNIGQMQNRFVKVNE